MSSTGFEEAKGSPAAHPAAAAREPWQPTRRQVVVIAAAVAVLYAAGVNDRWRIGNDSSLYLAVGRSLAQGHGFTHNQGQSAGGASPGVSVLAAASYLLFGEAFWPLNLAISVMGFAAAVLAYRIVRLYESRRTALNVFLLTGLSGALYLSSLDIESDAPGLFFLMGSLWCLLRFTRGKGWWWLAAGVAALLGGVAMRLPAGIMVAPIVAALLFEKCPLGRWRRVGGAAAIVGAFAAAGAGAALLVGRGQASSAGAGYFAAARERFAYAFDPVGSWLRPMGELPSNFFELVSGQSLPALEGLTGWRWLADGPAALVGVGLLLAALWGWGRSLRRRRLLVSLPALGYVLFLTLGWGAPAVRYLLLALPVLAWFLVDGAEAAVRGVLFRGRGEARVQVCVSLLVAALVAMNLPKAVREGVYRSHHPEFARLVKHGRLARWEPVTEFLRTQDLGAGEVVLTPDASVVHFLSGQPTAGMVRASSREAGYWQVVERGIGDRVVRFVVLPRDREADGLYEAIFDANRAAATVALQTEAYDVLACPAGRFTFPRPPRPAKGPVSGAVRR